MTIIQPCFTWPIGMHYRILRQHNNYSSSAIIIIVFHHYNIFNRITIIYKVIENEMNINYMLFRSHKPKQGKVNSFPILLVDATSSMNYEWEFILPAYN